jgi:hypothetical protein
MKYPYKGLYIPEIGMMDISIKHNDDRQSIAFFVNGKRILGYTSIYNTWGPELTRSCLEGEFTKRFTRQINAMESGISRAKIDKLKKWIDKNFDIDCEIDYLVR